MDLLELYRAMARARAFELVQADLWRRGSISGEMHLGTGEEAVAAGVTAQLRPGDAVAVDHRPTPVFLLLGVDPVRMLDEVLGRERGLCRGQGGHMHLFSKEHLAASSGIVGSSGPLAAGFALAAKRLRPGSAAVALFGDGAASQGMLLESLNLAAVWRLPLLFVCKQNGWAITTRTETTTAGDLLGRARAFSLAAERVDGGDAMAVYEAAGALLEPIRRGGGPAFLLAACPRLDGHFLGDAMVGAARHPIAEGRELLGKVLAAATASGGGPVGQRIASLAHMTRALRLARGGSREGRDDPLERCRRALDRRAAEVERIDAGVAEEITNAARAALEEVRP
ncbi:MAG TPA: thiamine pyrophosphate-dependent dehydrogenase E1 component subunit alpha [Myxococcales bacterium]|nr:thiamine pyrophosphate-dependent dehydrogenase E1 component subunit alpha [Myxococcales bacterium]